MANYSDIVNSIYQNYDLGKKYKLDLANYNGIEINVIIAIIINDFILNKSISRKKKKIYPSYKNKKYYALIYYIYELLQLCDEKDRNNLLENTSYLQILSEINNGGIILYKLKKYINITKTKKLDYCYMSAEYGSYNTFKFWNDPEITNLINTSKEINTLMLIKSIINPDERIYKLLLQKTSFSNELIKKIIMSLDSALNIPLKYKIRRVKILSSHININEYFNTIVFNLYDYKFITHLYRMVIRTNKHNYNDVSTLCRNIKNTNFYYYIDYLKDLYKYLNDIEKDYLTIYFGYNIIDPELHFSTSIRNLIKENYKEIILGLLNDKRLFKPNNKTIKILCEEKLFNKYLYIESLINKDLLLFTRFYYNKSDNHDYILHNKLLHLLRLKMKRIYNNKLNGHLNKMALLNNEITNFEPKNVPILKKGSSNYQYNKQKFSNIPPRHLIATLSTNIINELQVYTMFLLREKPDGILVNGLPINIYPKTDLFDNIKIKAEYIEEHDLYLVFDIDIPNTTIIERYEILRKNHPHTNKTKLEQINNLNDFMVIMTQEREKINNFMKEKSKIKWFPKFATLYDNNDNNQLVNHFIDFINSRNDNFKNSILQSKYYNCDGLIVSPLNYSREVKIKPNNLLTIDLLYNGKYFVDYENNNMDPLLFIDGNNYATNTIYRCYPDVFNNKFIVGEIRFDKYKPNKNSIIMNITKLLIHKYEKNLNNIKQELYYEKKGNMDYNLSQQLKEQKQLLNSILLSIEPKDKKKWLDLGCGNGKLLNNIQKFNPEYYCGIDIDIHKLIQGSQDDSINFIHTDLNTIWANKLQVKFDYIVANFSIMHFFSDIFWEQLNNVANMNTKFIFNTPSDNWLYKNSHMNIDNYYTYYNFEWVHDRTNKKEPFISKELINSMAKKYNWSINIYHNIEYTNKKTSRLVDCYSWFILNKL
jgi:2-polyprenyl-3-methyl-5-hydroxy-6-metoxy-1,4-benzoquinol methylase